MMEFNQFITITYIPDDIEPVDLPCYVSRYDPESDVLPLELTTNISEALEFTNHDLLIHCLETLDFNGFEGYSQDSHSDA